MQRCHFFVPPSFQRSYVVTQHFLARIDALHQVFFSAPCYIGNLLHLYTPNRLLRSSSKFHRQVPPSNLKTYRDRAFSAVCHCAHKLWNCLPNYIRFTPHVSAFKTLLYFLGNVSFIILFLFPLRSALELLFKALCK